MTDKGIVVISFLDAIIRRPHRTVQNQKGSSRVGFFDFWRLGNLCRDRNDQGSVAFFLHHAARAAMRIFVFRELG
jgi:hypothetical protein